jgi:hypothetical protein
MGGIALPRERILRRSLSYLPWLIRLGREMRVHTYPGPAGSQERVQVKEEHVANCGPKQQAWPTAVLPFPGLGRIESESQPKGSLDQCLLVVGRWVPEYLRGAVDRPLPRRWGEWPPCRHHVFPGGGGWYFLNACGTLDCGPGSPVVATRRHRRSHPALDRWTVRDVLVAGNLEAAGSPYRPGGIDFSIASGHSRSLPGKCPAPVGRMVAPVMEGRNDNCLAAAGRPARLGRCLVAYRGFRQPSMSQTLR